MIVGDVLQLTGDSTPPPPADPTIIAFGTFNGNIISIDPDVSVSNPVKQQLNTNSTAPGFPGGDCARKVGVLYLGMGGAGTITYTGGVSRMGVAATDDHVWTSVSYKNYASVGKPNSGVNAMVLDGDYLYIAGLFTTVNGTARNRAACIASDETLTTPTLQTWNPNLNQVVYCMVSYSGVLYFGGDFTTANGTARNYACAFTQTPSATTLRNWNPNFDNTPLSISNNGAVGYFAGLFTTVGGTGRSRLACIALTPDTASPTLYAWNPGANNTTDRAYYYNGYVYCGGLFTTIGGVSRSYIACLEATPATASPAVQNWQPTPDNRVQAILGYNGNIYFGGRFLNVYGTSRNYLACVQEAPTTSSPTLRAWNPSVSLHCFNLKLIAGP